METACEAGSSSYRTLSAEMKEHLFQALVKNGAVCIFRTMEEFMIELKQSYV